MKPILLVEDERAIRQALKKLLERHHYTTEEASSLPEAMAKKLDTFSLIISDVRLPGGEGTELITQTQTPVLIMTSYASLRAAVDAMKLGAIDYIAKPFNHDEMIAVVKKSLMATEQQCAHTLKSSASPATSTKIASIQSESSQMIGQHAIMKALQNTIDKVAPTSATVMILGESGTGKELVARAIHQGSLRHQNTIISVNCAAIPESLIESELFGHEKGAFTGAGAQRQGLVEAANEGTLFLDEIGELPLEAQARLLRVLQEGEIRRIGSVHTRKVDIRLLTATHRDLKTLVKQGKFREDLFYRLNVVQLTVPPLRDRGEDILELAEYFTNKISSRLNCPNRPFSEACKTAMCLYDWPGNVRELENAIERALILNEGLQIAFEDLGIEVIGSNLEQITLPTEQESQYQPGSLDDYFIHFVQTHESQLTETEIAKRLGISRKSLWERRHRLGIPRKKQKEPDLSE
jgi:two-component system response regulator HydG